MSQNHHDDSESKPSEEINQVPPPPETQWLPHPGIASWSNSRDMVLLLEGKTTFRIDLGRLQKYSETIREIFDLPTNLKDEGSEENPVVITGITVDEFASFMNWFDNIQWRSQTAHNVDEKFLLGVLAVCDKWLIDHGKEWAVNELNNLRPPLPSARRLDLAYRLRIPQFIRPSIEELMTRTVDGKHIRAISDDEIEQMGWRTYAVLARAHEALDVERAMMALVIPPLPKNTNCPDHSGCIRSFQQGWHDEVLPKLIGKNAEPLAQIRKDLSNTLFAFPRPFDLGCRTDLVYTLTTSGTETEGGYFQAEEKLIDAVVKRILEMYQLN